MPNLEGYPDPTCERAIGNIAKDEKVRSSKNPMVYICSPYSGDTKANTMAARRYSRFAVTKGKLPITPHLLFPRFLNENNPKERKLGLSFGLAMIRQCREIWVFGGKITQGMTHELNQARRKGKIIRYFDENMQEVTNV